MSEFTLLQEQVIRFSDMILLSHSILQLMNKSYGVYVSEYCFNTIVNKFKEQLQKVIIGAPRQRKLSNFEEFEEKCQEKLEQFESRELSLISGDMDAFNGSLAKLKRMMEKFEQIQSENKTENERIALQELPIHSKGGLLANNSSKKGLSLGKENKENNQFFYEELNRNKLKESHQSLSQSMKWCMKNMNSLPSKNGFTSVSIHL